MKLKVGMFVTFNNKTANIYTVNKLVGYMVEIIHIGTKDKQVKNVVGLRPYYLQVGDIINSGKGLYRKIFKIKYYFDDKRNKSEILILLTLNGIDVNIYEKDLRELEINFGD